MAAPRKAVPRKRVLRSVTVAERRSAIAAAKECLSSSEALSERETLAILRRKIAVQIDEGAPVHAMANLIRQFRQIDKDIRAIDATAAAAQAEEDDGDNSAAFDASSI